MASDESPSYWANPTVAPQWEAARDKLMAGKPLAPPSYTPVIVANKDDALVLKKVAGLVETPRLEWTQILSPDKATTDETVTICSISDEAILRLDGWINESSERLVRFHGKPRYAGRFLPLANVRTAGRPLL